MCSPFFLFPGRPGKPKGPLEATDVTKNGCKLKWKKPDDDGGVPIEYYEIEKLDPLTGQWIPCGKSTEPEANIGGLQEGKPYKFRVKAVNKEGESEELELDKPIIAKNPFGNNTTSTTFHIRSSYLFNFRGCFFFTPYSVCGLQPTFKSYIFHFYMYNKSEACYVQYCIDCFHF